MPSVRPQREARPSPGQALRHPPQGLLLLGPVLGGGLIGHLQAQPLPAAWLQDLEDGRPGSSRGVSLPSPLSSPLPGRVLVKPALPNQALGAPSRKGPVQPASPQPAAATAPAFLQGRVLARIPTGLGLLFRWHSVLAALAHRAPSRIGLQLDLDGSRCAERRQGPAPTPSANVCTPLSCLPGVQARGSSSLSRCSAFPSPLNLSCHALRTWLLLSPHDREERALAPPGPGPAWDPALGSVLNPWPWGRALTPQGTQRCPRLCLAAAASQAKDLADEGDHCCMGEHTLPGPWPTAPCSQSCCCDACRHGDCVSAPHRVLPARGDPALLWFFGASEQVK